MPNAEIAETTSGTQVALDACVLVNAALRDTSLRIAEPPRLYLPMWSQGIVDEMTRTLGGKLGSRYRRPLISSTR